MAFERSCHESERVGAERALFSRAESEPRRTRGTPRAAREPGSQTQHIAQQMHRTHLLVRKPLGAHACAARASSRGSRRRGGKARGRYSAALTRGGALLQRDVVVVVALGVLGGPQDDGAACKASREHDRQLALGGGREGRDSATSTHLNMMATAGRRKESARVARDGERGRGGRTRLKDVGDAPVDAVVLGVVRHDVLDEKQGLHGTSESAIEARREARAGSRTHKAACDTAGHEGESDKEEGPRAPRDAAAAVRVVLTHEPRLVDQVDDDHAERRTQAGRPVGEGDMDGDRVERRVVRVRDGLGVCREDARVEEGPPAKGELRVGAGGRGGGREEVGGGGSASLQAQRGRGRVHAPVLLQSRRGTLACAGPAPAA